MNPNVINARLQILIDECAEPRLREAMAYSLLANGRGKRLRPRLLLAACEAAGGVCDDAALDFACAVEMIHSYSLIHDDLPCMDDSDLRRGRPACHKVYGEALALLAGDGLLTHAMEVMSRRAAESDTLRPARAMHALTRGVGVNGMVAGQTLDMEWESKRADEAVLKRLQDGKTMAFIAACAEAGAILGGGNTDLVTNIRNIGENLGRAFQIKDDLLDVIGDAQTLGKPAQNDAKRFKNTYVSVLGMVRAEADCLRFSQAARGAAKGALLALAEEMLIRDK